MAADCVRCGQPDLMGSHRSVLMCGWRMADGGWGTLSLVLKRLAARKEPRHGMQGRPNFHVHFSKSAVAASLWDYGEEALLRCLIAGHAEAGTRPVLFRWRV